MGRGGGTKVWLIPWIRHKGSPLPSVSPWKNWWLSCLVASALPHWKRWIYSPSLGSTLTHIMLSEVFWVWFSLLPGCSVLCILLHVCHPVPYWLFLCFSQTELKCRDLIRVNSIPWRNATLFSTVEIFQRLLVYIDLSSLDLAFSRHSENEFISWFLSWVFSQLEISFSLSTATAALFHSSWFG